MKGLLEEFTMYFDIKVHMLIKNISKKCYTYIHIYVHLNKTLKCSRVYFGLPFIMNIELQGHIKHTHTHACACTLAFMHTDTHTHTNKHLCSHTYTCTSTHTHTSTRTHTSPHKYTHMHIHMC